MCLLTMSTPPALAGAMGTCSDYKPECIGEGQKILLYTALGLIAFGISGHMGSIDRFIADQATSFREEEFSMSFRPQLIIFSFWGLSLVPNILSIAFLFIKSWKIKFGILAMFTTVSTLVFLSGSSSYRRRKPQGSSLTTVVRVFVASISKLSYRCPRHASKLYERSDINDLYVVPHSRSLRFAFSRSLTLYCPLPLPSIHCT